MLVVDDGRTLQSSSWCFLSRNIHAIAIPTHFNQSVTVTFQSLTSSSSSHQRNLNTFQSVHKNYRLVTHIFTSSVNSSTFFKTFLFLSEISFSWAKCAQAFIPFRFSCDNLRNPHYLPFNTTHQNYISHTYNIHRYSHSFKKFINFQISGTSRLSVMYICSCWWIGSFFVVDHQRSLGMAAKSIILH